MPDTLIDTHCHIDFDTFDDDREEVLCNAAALGVKTIVVPSVSAATWSKTINICTKPRAHTAQSDHITKESPKLLLSLGLHPVFIDHHQPHHLVELDSLITKHRPVAVGEIGLDFYIRELDREKQLIYFDKQLIIAKQQQLPVIIHNRKAHDECINLLAHHEVRGGIIHAFNGSIQQAEKYIELGFLLGFGGMLTYSRSRKLKQLAKSLPVEAIVLETDAPDMTVAQRAGERNSPEYMPFILKELANIKAMDPSDLAQACTENFTLVFSMEH